MSSNNFSVEVIAEGVAKFKKDDFNYVSIKHKSNFKLKFTNNRDTPADAILTIEGVNNGTYRVPSHGSLTAERPSGAKKLFVALVEDTKESNSAGITTGDKDNGLITVKFVPEKDKYQKVRNLCHTNINNAITDKSSENCYTLSNECHIESTRTKCHLESARYEKYDECCESVEVSPKKSIFGRLADAFKTNEPKVQSEVNYKGVGIALGGESSQTFIDVPLITDVDELNVTTIKIRLVSPAEPEYISVRKAGNLANPKDPPRLN